MKRSPILLIATVGLASAKTITRSYETATDALLALSMENVLAHLQKLTMEEFKAILHKCKFEGVPLDPAKPEVLQTFEAACRVALEKTEFADSTDEFVRGCFDDLVEALAGKDDAAIKALIAEKPALGKSLEARNIILQSYAQEFVEVGKVGDENYRPADSDFEDYWLNFHAEAEETTSKEETAAPEAAPEAPAETPKAEEVVAATPTPEVGAAPAPVAETPAPPAQATPPAVTSVEAVAESMGISSKELNAGVSMAKGLRQLGKASATLGIEIAINALEGVKESNAILNEGK